ncbi:MAG: hypothetical protein EHM24_19645 [Acidobacteria bacterium]|nr:MAG: hypothetical protein EHM24_19645 [Acidobacteriota bacterium]
MLRAFAAQSILHALVAGLVVEALLRTWRLEDAVWRLRFRLIPLALPILALPAFLLAPGRATPAFAATWAIFDTGRWNLLRVGSLGVGDLVLALAAGVGSVLFLRDAVPPLLDEIGPPPRRGPDLPVPERLRAMADSHARALGIEPPAIRLLRGRLPVLLCVGARRPALVLSAATLEQLDVRSLEAAVAHELVHAAHRDPAWGYALIAARALTFFNPATQWAARAVVDELERRADQIAARLTRQPEALARSIALLALAAPPTGADIGDRFERLFWQSRVDAVRRRCERLVATGEPSGPAHARALLAATAAALVVLLFFVV